MKNYKVFHLTKEIGGIDFEEAPDVLWLKEGLRLEEIPLPCQVEYKMNGKRVFPIEVLKNWASQRSFSKHRDNMQEVMDVNHVVPARWWEMFFHYEGRCLHDGFWLEEGKGNRKEGYPSVENDSSFLALYPGVNRSLVRIEETKEVLCLMQNHDYGDRKGEKQKRIFIGFLIKEEECYRWIPSKEIKAPENVYVKQFYDKWSGLSMDFSVTSLKLFGFFKQRLPENIHGELFQERLAWFGLKVYEPWSYMKKTGLRKVTDNMSLVPYDEVKEDMSEHLWRPKEEISF